MNKVIVYLNGDKYAVVNPAPSYTGSLDDLASRVVPENKDYHIVDVAPIGMTSPEWNGTEWVEPVTPFDLDIMKHYRDENWSTKTVTLSNGAVIKVTKETRQDINDTFNAMQNAGIELYDGWNAENGTFEMTLNHFKEYSVLAMSVIKSSFDAYNYVVATHESTPYPSLDAAKADFDAAVQDT